MLEVKLAKKECFKLYISLKIHQRTQMADLADLDGFHCQLLRKGLKLEIPGGANAPLLPPYYATADCPFHLAKGHFYVHKD